MASTFLANMGRATISGASGNTLIVDTTTLVVDASNNRVGIGTASPAALLEVAGELRMGGKITNLTDPTAAQDAATKFYVDAVASGLDLKASVRVATATALPTNTAAGSGVGKTLTADANGALTIDGVSVAANDRVLVKNEATGANNGIYVVTDEGDGSNPFVLTRSTDADQNAEVTAGMFMFVSEGTTYADTGWVLVTNDPITVDTTALTFTQFSGAGSVSLAAIGASPNANGATLTGNTLNLEPASASFGGVVTTGTQTFAGTKTFSSAVVTGDFTVDTNSLFVDSANNRVGVGTVTPAVALDVVGAISGSGDLAIDTNVLFVDVTNNRVGINNGSPSVPLDVTGAAAISGNLAVDTSVLFVDASTNRVGINDATPSYDLDVTGEARATTGFLIGTQKIQNGSAAPVSGAWLQGDIVFNSAPDAGGNIGWVCTSSGSPGTWKEFGLVSE